MRNRAISLLLGLALILTACGGAEPGTLEWAAERLSATSFPQPRGIEAATLTDQRGEPVEILRAMRGKITFLYFGYTHCPDACPVTMARLARGLALLEPAERAGIQVIFVTLDPDRDGPEEMGAWLGAIDPEFIGLTGTNEEVQGVLGSLGYRMPPPDGPREGAYEVAHPATLFLFTPEPLGRFGYAFDALAPEALAADVRTLESVAW